jgi:succinoglycan biosynthesis transport protein ExoP
LAVLQVAGAPAIRIEYRSSIPEQTARIANAIADAYIEDQLNAKSAATQTASRFLSDRITELGSQFRAAEAAVAQFRSNKGPVESGQGPSPIDQQLGALSSELVTARLG